MAGLTLTQAEEQLQQWLAASSAVAKGQSYEIGGRKLTRADAGDVRLMVDYWQGWARRLGGEAGFRQMVITSQKGA